MQEFKGKTRRFRRYHYKVYFPENVGQIILEFIDQLGNKEIGYTHHAGEESLKDKRSEIPKITRKDLFDNRNTLVELYEILSKNGRPTGRGQKIVVRVHHLSKKYDYTYVVARESFVVSNWTNDKNDDHRLINEGVLYYRPIKKARKHPVEDA